MSPQSAPPALPFRTVLLSAVGIWAVYFGLVTLRSFISDSSGHWDMMWRRGLVTLAGIGITLAIWLVMRRVTGRPMRTQIALMAQLAVPGALLIAWINNLAFAALDKSYSILDDVPAPRDFPPPPPGTSGPSPPTTAPPTIRLERDADGNYVIAVPGAPVVVVRDPKADSPRQYWREVSEVALGRYFLLIAWGALFLALSNAERVRLAERREADLRRAAKAAELRSLRYQVNPHFLFNTLNSLSSLVLSGRNTDAEAMIQTLSTFYRTSLTGDPTDDVPLSEEVRLQRLYLEIEAVRFPERLRAVFDVPDDLADACVPGLILQPLVENAVKHAVAATNRPVTITIAARQAGNILRLSVSDDGPGKSDDRNGCGIGMSNVRDRLAARYGTAEGLLIDTTPPGYRVVLMMLLTRSGC